MMCGRPSSLNGTLLSLFRWGPGSLPASVSDDSGDVPGLGSHDLSFFVPYPMLP